MGAAQRVETLKYIFLLVAIRAAPLAHKVRCCAPSWEKDFYCWEALSLDHELLQPEFKGLAKCGSGHRLVIVPGLGLGWAQRTNRVTRRMEM